MKEQLNIQERGWILGSIKRFRWRLDRWKDGKKRKKNTSIRTPSFPHRKTGVLINIGGLLTSYGKVNSSYPSDRASIFCRKQKVKLAMRERAGEAEVWAK